MHARPEGVLCSRQAQRGLPFLSTLLSTLQWSGLSLMATPVCLESGKCRLCALEEEEIEFGEHVANFTTICNAEECLEG